MSRQEVDGELVHRPRRRPGARSVGTVLALIVTVACLASTLAPSAGSAAVSSRAGEVERAQAPGGAGGSSLEAAAAKAGATGRAVAMSLIGLAFAVAATVLAFRRDFKEAAGVFAVGIVSVLLATPTGISLLRDTVGSLFGGQ
ncbi:MAG TPA: hypothetical protein VIH49_03940 [Solirubrobacteraceae bacterium]